jgi:hypothetical protein
MSQLLVHVDEALLNMSAEQPVSTQLLYLNCFVLGDKPNETLNPNETFPIEILKTKNVGILKDLIKEKKAHRLKHVDASELEVFLVSESFLIDDLASRQPPTDGTPLRPNKRLSSLFAGDLSEDDLHVWVKAPLSTSPRYSLSNFFLTCVDLEQISRHQSPARSCHSCRFAATSSATNETHSSQSKFRKTRTSAFLRR